MKAPERAPRRATRPGALRRGGAGERVAGKQAAGKQAVRLTAVLLLGGALLSAGLSACAPPPRGSARGTSSRPYLQVMLGNHLYRRGDTLGAVWRYLQALQALDAAAGTRAVPPGPSALPGPSAPPGLSAPPGPAAHGARVSYNLSNVYASLGEVEAALARLEGVGEEAAGGADPELAFRANFNLGCLEYNLGRHGGAAAAFIRALKIRPASWEAKVNLELCLAKLQGAPQAPRRPDIGPRPRLSERDRRLLSEIHAKERMLWQEEARTGETPDGSPDW